MRVVVCTGRKVNTAGDSRQTTEQNFAHTGPQQNSLHRSQKSVASEHAVPESCGSHYHDAMFVAPKKLKGHPSPVGSHECAFS